MRITILVVLLMGSSAFAVAPDPVDMREPRPGELIKTDQDSFEVKVSPYLNGKKYQCTVTQGTTVWKSPEEQYPMTKMNRADLSRFRTGPAEAACQVFFHGAWLPPGKVSFEFAGQGPATSPDDNKALTGPGQTFALNQAGHRGGPKLKVSLAVGSGGWRITHPSSHITDSSVEFHHVNDLGQVAAVAAFDCVNANAADCIAQGLQQFYCNTEMGDAKIEKINENRSFCSNTYVLEGRMNKNVEKAKRTRADHKVYRVGVVEYSPQNHMYAVCSAHHEDDAATLVAARRFCESMKIVK